MFRVFEASGSLEYSGYLVDILVELKQKTEVQKHYTAFVWCNSVSFRNNRDK